MDEVSGLYYAQARNYQPEAGRFLTENTHWNTYNRIYGNNSGNGPMPDMAAIMQSRNLYAYCMNNPICFVDSLGLKAGDRFNSELDALKNMYTEYYGITDYTQYEIISALYKVYELNSIGNPMFYFSYTEPIIGTPHHAYPEYTLSDVPKDSAL